MKKGRMGLRILYGTLLLLIIGFVLLIRFSYQTSAIGRELTLDRVYELADRGQVVSVKLLDEDAQVQGAYCENASGATGAFGVPGQIGQPNQPQAPVSSEACTGKQARFHSSYPRSDVATQQLIEKVIASGASIDIDKQSDKAVAKLVATFVFPLVMLANLFGLIFMSKGGESSIADIAGFGTIRKKAARKRHVNTGVNFTHVAGAGEAVVEMREVTEYLTDPEKFKAYGASAPKGVLLFGPPGCGKTLLARAVAGETGVPFLSMSGAEFVESLVGIGAARVRDLFRQVREVAPAIVFIDEIDAVGRKREGEGSTGGEREQTINQLLIEIDGFDSAAGIVVMGATNRPDILDPALLRPGRFDRHVTLAPPDIHGRREILELHAEGKPMGPDVDFDFLARRTPGFTGADLANVVNEAALLAIREEETEVSTAHLTEAIQRVLHGPQRRGQLMSPEERTRIAFHESGHCVVAAAVGKGDEVQRASIVARGRGLGQSMMASENERVLLTRSDLRAEMVVSLAGIAAEKTFFGESSTTAEQDLEKANDLARQMVGSYGMSENIGGLRLVNIHDDGFLGSRNVMEAASPKTMEHFDNEVKRLIDAAERQAMKIIGDHRSQMESMAQRLEQDETLEGSVLSSILAAVTREADLFGAADRLSEFDKNGKTPSTKSAARIDR
ncbi:MAG: ATP-dependent zinc metalloprotease FtsH [Actinomycetota bacterium]